MCKPTIFLSNFDDEALGVGLYTGRATQPYFNSQSEHSMDR